MNLPLRPNDDNLTREVRARVAQGKIEPLENLDLEEGEEVVILVRNKGRQVKIKEILEKTAGAWAGTL